jgi:hypothetical protein
MFLFYRFLGPTSNPSGGALSLFGFVHDQDLSGSGLLSTLLYRSFSARYVSRVLDEDCGDYPQLPVIFNKSIHKSALSIVTGERRPYEVLQVKSELRSTLWQSTFGPSERSRRLQ